MRAVVVFHDESNHFLAWMLEEGFAHVGVFFDIDGQWVLFDPGVGTPEIRISAYSEFDMIAYCRQHGMTVVETECVDAFPRSIWLLNNCVGLVKKLLGIRNFLIWTPYQLYRHLEKRNASRLRRTVRRGKIEGGAASPATQAH